MSENFKTGLEKLCETTGMELDIMSRRDGFVIDLRINLFGNIDSKEAQTIVYEGIKKFFIGEESGK